MCLLTSSGNTYKCSYHCANVAMIIVVVVFIIVALFIVYYGNCQSSATISSSTGYLLACHHSLYSCYTQCSYHQLQNKNTCLTVTLVILRYIIPERRHTLKWGHFSNDLLAHIQESCVTRWTLYDQDKSIMRCLWQLTMDYCNISIYTGQSDNSSYHRVKTSQYPLL